MNPGLKSKSDIVTTHYSLSKFLSRLGSKHIFLERFSHSTEYIRMPHAVDSNNNYYGARLLHYTPLLITLGYHQRNPKSSVPWYP